MLQNGANLSECLSVKNRGEVWFGPLANGDVVCLLLNRFETPETMVCPFAAIGAQNISTAVNLWTGERTPKAAVGIVATVLPHDVVVLRISPSRH
jgi:hypothetical protein